MTADFNKPTIDDLYTNVFTLMRENMAEQVKMLDASTAINLPVGAKRWNATTKRFEKWSGTAWSELLPKATSSFDMRVAQADDLLISAGVTAKGQGQVGNAPNTPGGTDADGYTTPGRFFIGSASAVSNWPTVGIGGFLVVDAVVGGTYLRQTFTDYNAAKVWVRVSSNAGVAWTPWKDAAATPDWAAAEGADAFIANKPTLGTAAALAAQTSLTDTTADMLMKVGAFGLGGEAVIYSGDLNGIGHTSFYYSNGTQNRPVPNNGYVHTVAAPGGDYAMQIYVPAAMHSRFVRYKDIGVWGPWGSLSGDGFAVQKTVDQSIAAETVTLLSWQSEIYDEYADFASSKYTVTQPGKYMLGGSAYISGTDGQANSLYIRVNGSTVMADYQKEYGAGGVVSCFVPRQLYVDDVVELYVSCGLASTVLNNSYTRFWGFRL